MRGPLRATGYGVTPPSYTVSPFEAGLLQHRATVGALVAVGLAPAGQVPRRWTVTRVARRRCRGGVEQVGRVAALEELGWCDARRLANAVRRGLHETGLSLRAAA